MNEGQRRLSDEEILQIGSDMAMQSMMFGLTDKQGRMYILSDGRYSTAHVERYGAIVNQDFKGDEYPNGIDAFIEDKATEPNCLGLVPLTQSAHDRLVALGLRRTAEGIQLVPEGYKAVLFSLEQD